MDCYKIRGIKLGDNFVTYLKPRHGEQFVKVITVNTKLIIIELTQIRETKIISFSLPIN